MAVFLAFDAADRELGRCEARTRGEADREFLTRPYARAIARVQSEASHAVQRLEPPPGRRNNDDDQDGA